MREESSTHTSTASEHWRMKQRSQERTQEMHTGGTGVCLRLIVGELHHLRGGETLDGGRAGTLAERAAEASIKRGDLVPSR